MYLSEGPHITSVSLIRSSCAVWPALPCQHSAHDPDVRLAFQIEHVRQQMAADMAQWRAAQMMPKRRRRSPHVH